MVNTLSFVILMTQDNGGIVIFYHIKVHQSLIWNKHLKLNFITSNEEHKMPEIF